MNKTENIKSNVPSLPKDWKIKKLGDVCEFENGDRGVNYPSKSHRTETGLPFINAGHLTSDGLNLDSMDYISRERFNLLGSGKIKKGDILFCLRGSLGKFAKVQEISEGAIASSLVIIRPKTKVNTDFLMLYLESQICADMIKNFGNGAAQPNLSAGSLKRFEIPIPQLPEQKRIVEKLDEAFSVIERSRNIAEKNLQNAKELFQSKLQSIFENKGADWEEKTLGEVCIKIQDGAHHSPKNVYTERELGLYPYITSKNIRNNYMILSNMKFVDEGYHLSIYPRCKPELGDILLTKDGANTGNITINSLDEPFSLLSSVCLIKPNKSIVLSEFIKYYVQSPLGFKIITGKMTGAAIKRIILRAIKNALIPLPLISEQKQIVIELDALQTKCKKMELIYQHKVDNLEELKKSLLNKAFKGEL